MFNRQLTAAEETRRLHCRVFGGWADRAFHAGGRCISDACRGRETDIPAAGFPPAPKPARLGQAPGSVQAFSGRRTSARGPDARQDLSPLGRPPRSAAAPSAGHAGGGGGLWTWLPLSARARRGGGHLLVRAAGDPGFLAIFPAFLRLHPGRYRVAASARPEAFIAAWSRSFPGRYDAGAIRDLASCYRHPGRAGDDRACRGRRAQGDRQPGALALYGPHRAHRQSADQASAGTGIAAGKGPS